MLKQINIFIEMIICVTVDSKSYNRHLCQPESLFFNKVAGLRPLFKNKALAQIFSCGFC